MLILVIIVYSLLAFFEFRFLYKKNGGMTFGQTQYWGEKVKNSVLNAYSGTDAAEIPTKVIQETTGKAEYKTNYVKIVNIQ